MSTSPRCPVRLGTDLYWSGSETAFRSVTALLRDRLAEAEEGLRAEVDASASFGWLAPADLPEPERTTVLRALAEAAVDSARGAQEPDTASELTLLALLAQQALRQREAS